MNFDVDIQDIEVNVSISFDEFTFSIVEEIIDVDISDQVFNIDLSEEVINVELSEDVIEVTLDGSCICVNGGGSGDATASEVYECDGTLVLGDLVYLSPTIIHYVVKAVDNDSVNPVIGVVTQVVSLTTVQVTHLGFFDVTAILESGKKVFISGTGAVTTNIPLDKYLQCLGVAISTSRMFLNPELVRKKRLEI